MMSKLISISAERFELIKTIKEQNEQISKNLLMDTLTRLPNLKALGNYFDRYVELAIVHSILYMFCISVSKILNK